MGDLTNPNVVKTVTFDEPTGEAALAVMGTWNGGTFPGLFVQCTCTRTLSNWNYADLSANGKQWFSPVAQTQDPNTAFVSHWFATAYKPNNRGVVYKGYVFVVYFVLIVSCLYRRRIGVFVYFALVDILACVIGILYCFVTSSFFFF
jgi:hypothetical protein